mmetsp:Transcript_17933/g.42265  ORF Transcript_17933/g.42265 Transcript_17933/m.42265 type:complete len:240 (+) Transcript_17933:563-1282(+)
MLAERGRTNAGEEGRRRDMEGEGGRTVDGVRVSVGVLGEGVRLVVRFVVRLAGAGDCGVSAAELKGFWAVGVTATVADPVSFGVEGRSGEGGRTREADSGRPVVVADPGREVAEGGREVATTPRGFSDCTRGSFGSTPGKASITLYTKSLSRIAAIICRDEQNFDGDDPPKVGTFNPLPILLPWNTKVCLLFAAGSEKMNGFFALVGVGGARKANGAGGPRLLWLRRKATDSKSCKRRC